MALHYDKMSDALREFVAVWKVTQNSFDLDEQEVIQNLVNDLEHFFSEHSDYEPEY